MADISKIKAINGTTYNIKDSVARTGNIETSRLVRPTKINGVVDNTIVPQVDDLRANRLAFLPASQIIIEQTIDGGATWTDAGISDSAKQGLFAQTRPGINLPRINGEKNILCGLRVTFTAMRYNVPSGTTETQKYNYWNSTYVASTERYNQLREMYFWVNSNTDAIKVKVERATGANPNNWVTLFDRSDYAMTGWSGNDYVSFSQGVFGGGTNQTGNYWNYRLTFFTCGANGSSTLSGTNMTTAQAISEIRGYGTTWWTAGNRLASSDHMYSWDINQNVTFPGSVTATNFNGTVNGYTLAGASAKGVDTSIAAASTSTNLPTSQAVASFVEGKGYTTNTGTVTGVKVNGTTKSPTSGVVDIGTVITSHQDISGKADKADTVLSTTLSRGRKANTTVGTGSFAFGDNVTASGVYSHAEGNGTTASGGQSHAEGYNTTASGYHSHAEGYNTTSSGYYSHAEGNSTTASGYYSHAEGYNTISRRSYQHVGGKYNVADVDGSAYSSGNLIEIIGNGTADDARSNARALDWDGNEYLKGDLYVNCGSDSSNGTAVGTTLANKADKSDTVLDTTLSRSRKANTTVGTGSFAFGYNVTASGGYSHAEGTSTTASGINSHSEGYSTSAEGGYSHTEGYGTIASGSNSHVSGMYNVADSYSNWPEWVSGKAYAVGDKVKITAGSSVNGYICKTANSDTTFTYIKWISQTKMNYAEIIGNGTADNNRSNARALDWDGNEYLAGDLYIGCSSSSTGGKSVGNTVLTPSTAFAIPSSGSSVVYNMDGMTENHVLVAWRFSTSAENNPPCSLTWTTYNGYFSITNTSGTGGENIQPVFAIPTEKAITNHT